MSKKIIKDTLHNLNIMDENKINEIIKYLKENKDYFQQLEFLEKQEISSYGIEIIMDQVMKLSEDETSENSSIIISENSIIEQISKQSSSIENLSEKSTDNTALYEILDIFNIDKNLQEKIITYFSKNKDFCDQKNFLIKNGLDEDVIEIIQEKQLECYGIKVKNEFTLNESKISKNKNVSNLNQENQKLIIINQILDKYKIDHQQQLKIQSFFKQDREFQEQFNFFTYMNIDSVIQNEILDLNFKSDDELKKMIKKTEIIDYKNFTYIKPVERSVKELFNELKKKNINFNFNKIEEELQQIEEHLKKRNSYKTKIKNFCNIIQKVQECFKITPRKIQIISVLLFLNKDIDKGRLLQINTGEGKTLIIAMIAAYFGLLGKNVDIVTSSNNLAMRDSQENEEFFKSLNLNVGHNIDFYLQYDGSQKNVYQECQILYGTVSEFTADYLRDFTNNEQISQREKNILIVDEVDNMLIDSSNFITKLSDSGKGLEQLQNVRKYIWTQLNLIFFLMEVNNQIIWIKQYIIVY